MPKRARGILFTVLWYGSIMLGFYALYCPVLPIILINRRVYRKATERIFVIWESFAVAILEIIFKVNFIVTGDVIDAKESSIVILNHRNRLDWNFFWGALAHRTLPPSHNCKMLLKSGIKHFPGVGWIMQMTCFLYLKRSFSDDKITISRSLNYFNRNNYKYQILIFPEGTNLSKTTKQRSNDFASKSGLPAYDFVLHPRTAGFTYLAQQMIEGKNLDAVYDVTVMYPKTLPETELDILNGNFPEEVHFLIKRYPIEIIPTSEEGLKEWLRQIWDQKEETLRGAYSRGYFVESSDKPCKLNASYLSLLFWFLLMAGMLYLLWNSAFIQGWCILFSIFFISVSVFTDGLQDFEISSYERSKNK